MTLCSWYLADSFQTSFSLTSGHFTHIPARVQLLHTDTHSNKPSDDELCVCFSKDKGNSTTCCSH